MSGIAFVVLTRVGVIPTSGGELGWLSGLPGVRAVAYENGDAVVSGGGPLLANVATALSERGLVPADLRSERATLEDVFLKLTRKKIRE